MSAGVPPNLSTVGYVTDEYGEITDHLAGLRDEGLLGAQVWTVSHQELSPDGDMLPVYKGGTIVWFDEDTVTVVSMERRYGKPSARVDRIEYKDIVPDQNVPATAGQRNKLARFLCTVLGAHKGQFEGWERHLIGYAASLANR